MIQEISEIKKMVDKLNLKINQLSLPNKNEKISINLYLEILELLKKTFVNFCIAEMNEKMYNIIIVDIETAIRNLKDKDKTFNSKFNKRELVKNIIKDYQEDTYIIIESEVSKFIHQTHNKELDKYVEFAIITFFRKRMSIIENINEKEESLRIINPN